MSGVNQMLDEQRARMREPLQALRRNIQSEAQQVLPS